jgi:tetratricopeptide (TPR) repeat protein
VTVTGEPGVGKSRLIGEFYAWIDAEPDIIQWRHGRCLPYGDGVTFWALGEIVKAQAGILETDAPADADAKLVAAVELVVEDVADRDWIAGHLAALVGSRPGSEASADRAETISAWRAFLEGTAAFRPLILAIEDLHWADDAMIDFVEHLADWATGVPLLILCSARPELYERRPGWGGGKRNSTTVGLSPLQTDEIAALVSAMLNETLLPAETQSALLERAGGNPLYAEEFVRMLTDRGILQHSGVTWRIVSDGDIPVPETVQALIAARMDTLSAERKALLYDAAVVGRTFWPGVLATMGAADQADVVNGLHELLRKELVRPVRRSSMQGEEEYTFWHILVRDVAYAQIPRAQRAERHRKAAAWIERAAGERVGDHADILAHHYLQAIELGGGADGGEDLRANAAKYLYLAGERAMRLDRGGAAVVFRQALELTGPGGPWYAQIRFGLGGSYFAAGRQVEALAEYEAAREAFVEAGDVIRAADCMTLMSRALRHRDEMQRSREILAEARSILEAQPPGAELVDVYAAFAGDAMLAARFSESFDFAQKAIELADKLGLPEAKVRPLQARGLARWDRLDAEGARADLEASLELGLQLGDAGETGIAFNNYAGVRLSLDGPAAALETYREGIAFDIRRGVDGARLWSTAETTWCLYDLGRWDELLDVADEIEAEARARDWSQIASLVIPGKIKVLALRGQLDEAAALATANVPAARQVGDPQLVLPALEAQALVDSYRGRPAEMIAALREVLDVIGRTSATSVEPTDLVRLAALAGDIDVAKALFETIRIIPGRFENIAISGRAAIAKAEGRLDEAAALYADAASRWQAHGNVIEHGHALVGMGKSALGQGRSGDAVDPLRQARELFAAPGATLLVAEIDDLLAQTTARAG